MEELHMPSRSPVQTVKKVLEEQMSLFSQHGFTYREESGEDIDRGVCTFHVFNEVAKGYLEIDEGGSGYIEVIHQPSGRHMLRQFIDDYSSSKARAAAKKFSKILLQADPCVIPAELPIQLQFYDWIRSNAKSSSLPRSPWVHSGSMSHPGTNDFINDPPPTVTLTFSHCVSNQSILLTVGQDGYALIEKQEVRRGPIQLIRKVRIESVADFAGLYEQSHALAVSSGPSSV